MMAHNAQDAQLLATLGLSIDAGANVLICCREGCRHALPADGSRTTTHLRDKHKVSLDARRGLTRTLGTLNLQNPAQVAPGEDRSPEHPLLQTHEGYACRYCAFRTISLQLSKRHYADPQVADDCPMVKVGAREDLRDVGNFTEYAPIASTQVSYPVMSSSSCELSLPLPEQQATRSSS